MTTEKAKRNPNPKTKTIAKVETKLFTLQVSVISGPIKKSFAKKNRVISRTIQIRSDQTLTQFHDAIFDAFNRFDEHMYEFQFGGKTTMDPKAKRYVLPLELEDPFGDSAAAGVVTETTVGSLGLKVGSVFAYWFDFGDDWWHQINVVAIDNEIPPGKYPKVIAREGQSPPQYPDVDE